MQRSSVPFGGGSALTRKWFSMSCRERSCRAVNWIHDKRFVTASPLAAGPLKWPPRLVLAPFHCFEPAQISFNDGVPRLTSKQKGYSVAYGKLIGTWRETVTKYCEVRSQPGPRYRPINTVLLSCLDCIYPLVRLSLYVKSIIVCSKITFKLQSITEYRVPLRGGGFHPRFVVTSSSHRHSSLPEEKARN
jgi:hypothetical protein